MSFPSDRLRRKAGASSRAEPLTKAIAAHPPESPLAAASRASMHLAMLHLPRVEDRVTALFADLAERFGRVTADGVVIDLPLTHDLIGSLVGSRRPTVTLALHRLATNRVLERLDDNRWKLDHKVVSP